MDYLLRLLTQLIHVDRRGLRHVHVFGQRSEVWDGAPIASSFASLVRFGLRLCSLLRDNGVIDSVLCNLCGSPLAWTGNVSFFGEPGPIVRAGASLFYLLLWSAK